VWGDILDVYLYNKQNSITNTYLNNVVKDTAVEVTGTSSWCSRAGYTCVHTDGKDFRITYK